MRFLSEEGFVKESAISDYLEDYVTESGLSDYLSREGYVTSYYLDDNYYITESYLENYLSNSDIESYLSEGISGLALLVKQDELSAYMSEALDDYVSDSYLSEVLASYVSETAFSQVMEDYLSVNGETVYNAISQYINPQAQGGDE